MIDPSYPALSTALAGSVLWRAAVAAVDACSTAWRSSTTARIVGGAAHLRSTRVLALIAAVAGIAWVAAQTALPAYVRSGLPVMWPLTAIAFALLVAVLAPAFERAWAASTLGRALTPSRRDR